MQTRNPETGLVRCDGITPPVLFTSHTTMTDPTSSAWLDGQLYLRLFDSEHGAELWRTDGTTLGTLLAADVNDGTGSSLPASIFAHGGSIYFNINQSRMYRYSPGGGLLNLGGPPLALCFPVGVAGDAVYARDTTGRTLNATDGTPESSRLLATLMKPNDVAWYGWSAAINGKALLAIDTWDHNGIRDEYDLWLSDGTSAGTVPLVSGANVHPRSASDPSRPVVVGDRAYFTADDPLHGRALMRTDGTVQGTSIVFDPRWSTDHAFPTVRGVCDGRVAVTATTHRGLEIFTFDPDAPEVTSHFLVTPANLTGFAFLGIGGANIYFAYDDLSSGVEPWVVDTATNAASRVSDLMPGAGASTPAALYASGEVVYATASTAATGREVYVLSPTGASLVSDSWAGTNSGAPTEVVPLSGHLVNNARNATGRGLFSLTPTANNMLVQLPVAANPTGLTAFDSGLLFWNGTELWRSDLTQPGTSMVVNITSPAGGPARESLISVGPRALFRRYIAANTFELWSTDGTLAGTFHLPGPNLDLTLNPYRQMVKDGVLYFQASDSTNGRELWRSDGTPQGTRLVVDLNPGVANSSISGIASPDGLFFSAAVPSASLVPRHIPFYYDTLNPPAPLYDIHPYVSLYSATYYKVGTRVFARFSHPTYGNELFFIHPPRTCGTADFNNDGDTGTDQDIEAFFACIGGHCCPSCGTADFNNDGDTGTDQDIEAFFRVLGGHPC
ncbi:MAG TPA: ELWxxDGT repeat protein [Phycisphaerales bacterium]|nr:ELWxxDGT repeat protein [Phycisphaerales bacterium]